MKKLSEGYQPRFLPTNVEGYEEELSPRLRGMVRDYAQQMVKEYRDRVRGSFAMLKAYPKDEWIQQRWTLEYIEKFASGADDLQALEKLRRKLFEEITWDDVHNAKEQNAEETLAMLLVMHNGAEDALAAGVYAARAVGVRTPYERAQFAVIRNGFIAEWQPRGGMESGLVDMLTQSFVAWQYWLHRSFDISNHEYEVEEQVAKSKTLHEGGTWKPPRVTASQYLEQAAQMADRYQRMFLRTLRQMRDLRRYSVPVTINNPQQVNIAADGGQQVNVQKKAKKRPKDMRKVQRVCPPLSRQCKGR